MCEFFRENHLLLFCDDVLPLHVECAPSLYDENAHVCSKMCEFLETIHFGRMMCCT